MGTESNKPIFTIYVLYSQKHAKHYVGYTTDLAERYLSHNHLSSKGWTVKYRPWEIIHVEEYATKEEAMKRERWLKSGVGRDFIKALPH
jgi:putative endonuclease